MGVETNSFLNVAASAFVLRSLMLCSLLHAGAAPKIPLKADFMKTTTYRWLQKAVLESRVLDSMEDLSTWKLENLQATGVIGLASRPVFEGSFSLKLECPTTGEKILGDRYFGFARVHRVIDREDWSQWNRVSFWVYPDMPGHHNISLLTVLHNDGKQKVPDRYGKMGMNYVLVRNREWNHVVWEIANLPRETVTSFELQYRMQGNEPGAAEKAVFYFDKLALEKVDADQYEGWNVAHGRIAYSHVGYLPGLRKTALGSNLDAATFELIDVGTGQVVFSGNVRTEQAVTGTFQIMDFSLFNEPGQYFVRVGDLQTQPFRIDAGVWEETIWAILNFFYTERCGIRIPGVHESCHRDWLGKHGDQTIIINGGWHDAGDLSQGLTNTGEGVYAMFALAEHLACRKVLPELQGQLVAEATWGLDWVMKTRFPDGARIHWATHDRWTNGIIGDSDDQMAQAAISRIGSYRAAAAEGIAARVLKDDPQLAKRSLQMALADWETAEKATPGDNRRRGRPIELAAFGAHAALELFKTTGEETYADRAVELAGILLDSQEREVLPGLDERITGFFYESPRKERILRYDHLSEQQMPVMVLAELCRTLPEHRNCPKWREAADLYSKDYVQAMARYSGPYNMLAASLYTEEDAQNPSPRSDMTSESYVAQVKNGVKVGTQHYVRRFPVWFQFRGSNGVLMSETVGLAATATLRQDRDVLSLVQEQLMWMVGRNPFGQSTVFGVGYDYAPQYSAMYGDHVGSTAVGIQSRHDHDTPYWPAENCHNWKETWVHPAVRWLQVMRYLGEALAHDDSSEM